MEITSVEPVLLSHVYPEGEELVAPVGLIESWDAALVKVTASDGTVGWGEVGQGAVGGRAVPGVLSALDDHVIGRNPEDVVAIREDLYHKNLMWARGALPMGVIGAIEIALYDLLGHVHDLPVYALLGGKANDDVRAYASGGVAATLEARVDQVKRYEARGFDVVKIRALQEPDRNAELIDRAVAETSTVEIAVDAVQGTASSPWTVGDAIDVGRALEAHEDRIYFYEEPCRVENLEGYRRVRDALSIPIAGHESRVGRFEFRDVIDADAVDVLQPDVTFAGGFAETRRISTYAGTHHVPLAMHMWGSGVSMLANLHYAATDPNCRIVEFVREDNPLREELLPGDLTYRDGALTLPSGPGLGLDVPDDLEERFEFAPEKGITYHDR